MARACCLLFDVSVPCLLAVVWCSLYVAERSVLFGV